VHIKQNLDYEYLPSVSLRLSELIPSDDFYPIDDGDYECINTRTGATYRLKYKQTSDGTTYGYMPTSHEGLQNGDTLLFKTTYKDISITYDANGGSYNGTTYDSVRVRAGTWMLGYNLPEEVPTRVDYKFLGWSLNQDGTGTLYSSGEYFEVDYYNEGYTFYAIWQPLCYLDPYAIVDGVRYYDTYDIAEYDVNVWDKDGNLICSEALRRGFCEQFPYGSTYKIFNINPNEGYKFIGVRTGDVQSLPIGESDIGEMPNGNGNVLALRSDVSGSLVHGFSVYTEFAVAK
jgi:hypothetical protein